MLKQRYKLAGFSAWARDGPVNLTSTNLLQCGPLTICRVGPNEIGLAFENATQPVLLAPGLHVYNTPDFKFAKTIDVQENLASYEPWWPIMLCCLHTLGKD